MSSWKSSWRIIDYHLLINPFFVFFHIYCPTLSSILRKSIFQLLVNLIFQAGSNLFIPLNIYIAIYILFWKWQIHTFLLTKTVQEICKLHSISHPFLVKYVKVPMHAHQVLHIIGYIFEYGSIRTLKSMSRHWNFRLKTGSAGTFWNGGDQKKKLLPEVGDSKSYYHKYLPERTS